MTADENPHAGELEFGLDAQTLMISEIFFPFALREMRKVRDNNIKFAYYTTADTAIRLLKTGEIWLRNSSEMNDFSEINYGLECLSLAMKKLGPRIKGLLDTPYPGLVDAAYNEFLATSSQLRLATFICCVSRHYNHEDDLGRLSMWRA